MSSFAEFEPVPHATKLTPFVRIDNDFSFTIVINDNGTLTTHYYNLQGMPDEFNYKPNPPDDVLVEARLAKDGTDESMVFRVNMFFNDNDDTLEDWEIPHAWIYNSAVDKDNYLPAELPATVNQVFPIVIWNQLTSQQTAPGANTVSATTFDSTYTTLGNVTERRKYLKHKLRGKTDDPMLPFIAMGSSVNPIVAKETTLSQNTQQRRQVEFTVTDDREHARRMQGFAFRLEMLTRAISVDSNLSTEGKFNLLVGEVDLDNADIFRKMSLSLNGDIADQQPRSGWTFRKFGSVASSSPFKYTAPTGMTLWSTTADADIDIGSNVPDDVTSNWLLWLRS